MRHRPTLLALGLLALAACADDAAPATGGGTRGSRPAQATPPPARVVAFDGRWSGTITLNPDRTRACPGATVQEREMTVAQGRARLILNPQTGQALSGSVNADGTARLADSLDRTIATSGVFNETVFLGEYRNGLCSYAVRLTKRD